MMYDRRQRYTQLDSLIMEISLLKNILILHKNSEVISGVVMDDFIQKLDDLRNEYETTHNFNLCRKKLNILRRKYNMLTDFM